LWTHIRTETFVADELAEHCYPDVVIEKNHRVAVRRAAQTDFNEIESDVGALAICIERRTSRIGR
jgi:hypothetical protein